jgi:hypothetical protein
MSVCNLAIANCARNFVKYKRALYAEKQNERLDYDRNTSRSRKLRV